MKLSAVKLLNATSYSDFSIEGKYCIDMKISCIIYSCLHQSPLLHNNNIVLTNSFIESEEIAGFNRVRRKRSVMRDPPKLGDIKLKVSIP